MIGKGKGILIEDEKKKKKIPQQIQEEFDCKVAEDLQKQEEKEAARLVELAKKDRILAQEMSRKEQERLAEEEREAKLKEMIRQKNVKKYK